MKLLLSLVALATSLVSAQLDGNGPCTMDVTLDCRTVDGNLPCNEIQPRSTNCFVSIQWNVMVRNTGSMLQVFQLDLLTDHTNLNMLVLSLPMNPIPIGQQAGMSPIYEINVCNDDASFSHTGSIAASAMATIGGGTCTGQQDFSFTVGSGSSGSSSSSSSGSSSEGGGGETISQPNPVPPPAPQPVFVPAPTLQPILQQDTSRTDDGEDDDGVLCGRIEGFIECNLENGQSCNTLVPRDTDCNDILLYTVTLRNTGEAPLDLSTANLILDSVPEPINVLSDLPTLNFAGGQSASAVVRAPIDTCGSIIAFNANAEIRAMHPVGTNCIPVPPSVPASPTTPAVEETVPQIVETEPLPAVAQRAVADCELDVRIECRLADGNSCNDIVGGEGAENCLVSFFYDVFLDNTGTVDMPVTSALFSNGNANGDAALNLSVNPVLAGQTSFASHSTVIDVCESPFLDEAQGRVNVATQPPTDVICSHLIPSPTTVFIGGTPPDSSPTDNATAGTNQERDPVPLLVNLRETPVSCIIDSRLEGCTLADNSPCQELNVETMGCIITFFYNVALENLGTVELTVTEATLETNGESINVLDHTPSAQLAIGQVRQARVPVELDVCNANQFSALVAAQAAPPAGFLCQ